MKKRGTSHLEMIASFVIFISVVSSSLIIFHPFSLADTSISEQSYTSEKTSVQDKTSITERVLNLVRTNLTINTIVINKTANITSNESQDSIAINIEYLAPKGYNLRVENASGTVLPSQINETDRNVIFFNWNISNGSLLYAMLNPEFKGFALEKLELTPPSICGDGEINQPCEDCDLGEDNGKDTSTCSVNCTLQKYVVLTDLNEAGPAPDNIPNIQCKGEGLTSTRKEIPTLTPVSVSLIEPARSISDVYEPYTLTMKASGRNLDPTDNFNNAIDFYTKASHLCDGRINLDQTFSCSKDLSAGIYSIYVQGHGISEDVAVEGPVTVIVNPSIYTQKSTINIPENPNKEFSFSTWIYFKGNPGSTTLLQRTIPGAGGTTYSVKMDSAKKLTFVLSSGARNDFVKLNSPLQQETLVNLIITGSREKMTLSVRDSQNTKKEEKTGFDLTSEAGTVEVAPLGFQGYILSSNYYDHVLTSNERDSIYNAPPSFTLPSDPSPVGDNTYPAERSVTSIVTECSVDCKKVLRLNNIDYIEEEDKQVREPLSIYTLLEGKLDKNSISSLRDEPNIIQASQPLSGEPAQKTGLNISCEYAKTIGGCLYTEYPFLVPDKTVHEMISIYSKDIISQANVSNYLSALYKNNYAELKEKLGLKNTDFSFELYLSDGSSLVKGEKEIPSGVAVNSESQTVRVLKTDGSIVSGEFIVKTW